MQIYKVQVEQEDVGMSRKPPVEKVHLERRWFLRGTLAVLCVGATGVSHPAWAYLKGGGKKPQGAKPQAQTAPQNISNSQNERWHTLQDGLRILDVRLGTGVAIQSGQIGTFHYSGKLVDGTVFDSSYKRNRPAEFPIGKGRLIKGWEQGIPGMREGGLRRLEIPPELGYGQKKTGLIPPGSVLVFDIELLKVR